MDVLNKTIKKLSEEEYQALIMQVSGKKKNKPYVVLETTRNRDVADAGVVGEAVAIRRQVAPARAAGAGARLAEGETAEAECAHRRIAGAVQADHALRGGEVGHGDRTGHRCLRRCQQGGGPETQNNLSQSALHDSL